MAKTKKIKVEIKLPVAGRFNLTYNVGDKVLLPELQATELIEAKYAVKVK